MLSIKKGEDLVIVKKQQNRYSHAIQAYQVSLNTSSTVYVHYCYCVPSREDNPNAVSNSVPNWLAEPERHGKLCVCVC